MLNRDRRPRPGLTLIELLVVVATISVLIALLFPAVQAARRGARKIQCGNNLRQLSLGLFHYQTALGVFPSAHVAESGNRPNPGWGWGSMVLPFCEQATLFSAANFALAVPAEAQETIRRARLSVFLCPESRGDGDASFEFYGSGSTVRALSLSPSQYVASGGQIPDVFTGETNGIFFENSATAVAGISDGLSTTLLLGERSRSLADSTWVGVAGHGIVCTNPAWPVRDCQPSHVMVVGYTGPDPISHRWDDVPNAPAAVVDDFWSDHAGGCNFSFADGSVRFVRATIDPRVFSSLSSRNGGETLSADQF